MSYNPPGDEGYGTPPGDGGYGAPPGGGGYGTPPGPGGYGAPAAPAPPSHLVWAILTTIFCCLPAGIVSIVYAAQVSSRWRSGDQAGAFSASRKARTWAIIAALAGVVILVIVGLSGLLGSGGDGGGGGGGGGY